MAIRLLSSRLISINAKCSVLSSCRLVGARFYKTSNYPTLYSQLKKEALNCDKKKLEEDDRKEDSKSSAQDEPLGVNSRVSILNGLSESELKRDRNDNVTVFLRPSARVLNFNLNHKQEEITLFLKPSDEIIDLKFHKDNGRSATKGDDKENKDDPDLQSIDELMWKPIERDLKSLPTHYLRLSKIRLTGLVVLTSMVGYAMAPGAFHTSTFLLVTIGTALQSASANAINQFFEVPYDAQMNRTKNRPIVRGNISPLHAVGFAAVTGSAGLAVLLLGVNPLTAGLGLANLLIYTLMYTPMKRIHIANTWLGSVVGAVPPMMGWAACAGQLDPGAWLLGAIMYAWQFPHFNALSWNLRQDYSRAGYRMTSVVNPELCKRVALRYSVGMIALCSLAPAVDLTTWMFAADSLPLNVYLTYLSWRFYKDGDSNSSRKLFRFTLIHLPALLILMIISKKTYGDASKKVPSGIVEVETASKKVPSGIVVEAETAAASLQLPQVVPSGNKAVDKS